MKTRAQTNGIKSPHARILPALSCDIASRQKGSHITLGVRKCEK